MLANVSNRIAKERGGGGTLAISSSEGGSALTWEGSLSYERSAKNRVRRRKNRKKPSSVRLFSWLTQQFAHFSPVPGSYESVNKEKKKRKKVKKREN